MATTHKLVLRSGLLCALVLVTGACTPKRAPPMTASDLMEDRVTLDGVLLKCNQAPAAARSDADCINARIAIERLANDVDPAEQIKRNEEFERRREQLRLVQERALQEQEARTKIDPYSLPVLPVEPSPEPHPAPANVPGPLTGQTGP